MNGYEKHGIGHVSASSINMYGMSPDAWVAKYLFGAKFSFGVAAQVGVFVEDAVADVLTGLDVDSALKGAYTKFDKKNALNTNEKELDRRNHIKPMMDLALEQLLPFGEPEFIHTLKGREQQRVDLMCNGGDFSVNIMGYLDFVYPKHDLIIDLKTTGRLPRSAMSEPHQIQGSIYAKAREGFEVRFLYVSTKDFVWHTVENVDETLAKVKEILRRQHALLSKLSKEEIKDIIPTTDTFYWSGGDDKIRKELFGV